MKPADRYEEWLGKLEQASAACHARVAELQFPRAIPDEELQARWYAGELGWRFNTVNGEMVEVLHFGRWNPEPGPVFIDAEVRFDGGEPQSGGIELRGDPACWGEVAEPEYDSTVLHLFAGAGVGGLGWKRPPSRTAAGREVPQVMLDVTAMEFDAPAIRSERGEGAPALAGFSPEQVTQLLEAAAQYRLLKKASRIERLSAQTSPSEGLYQAVAETLGYRRNKLPFTLLAQRFPVAGLRRVVEEIEPMLFAAAGFLPSALTGLAGDTRGYLQEVWNRWWPRRAEVERLVLPEGIWVMKGARPVNHPQRRVAALAEVARNWPVIESLVRMGEISAVRPFFTELKHDYWDHHYTLTSRRAAGRMALIGETRVHEILANVIYPLQVGSRSASADRQWSAYLRLAAQAGNEKLTRATDLFFSREQRAMVEKLLRRVVYQQGLLQLLENATRSCPNPHCGTCEPGERLRRW